MSIRYGTVSGTDTQICFKMFFFRRRKKHETKKTLSLTLAAAMTAGLLVGCGGGAASSSSTAAASSEATASSEAASSAAATSTAAGKVYYLNFKPEQDPLVSFAPAHRGMVILIETPIGWVFDAWEASESVFDPFVAQWV